MIKILKNQNLGIIVDIIGVKLRVEVNVVVDGKKEETINKYNKKCKKITF